MKNLIVLFFFLLLTQLTFGQKLFFTQTGFISFFSKAPLEDISAKNQNVNSTLNVETGEVKFKVPIKKFNFPNATMQEHFNENYLETEKYPYAEFNGRIMDYSNVNLKSDGTFNVTITGQMLIHGKTQVVTHKAVLVRTGETITGTGSFKIKLADYDVKIPKMVIKNIAEEVDVNVKMEYRPAPQK